LRRTDLTDASLWGRGFSVPTSNAQSGSATSSSKMPMSAKLWNPHLLLDIGDGKQAGDRLGMDGFEALRSANAKNEGFGNGSPAA
jgi:hypothetical protein